MPTVFEQQERAVDSSFAIDNTSAGDGDSINEKALMVESMELVEPRKTIQVPNHLLETKTYAKVGQNAIVHAKPAVVHFEGFEVGEKQTKKLVLLNASPDVLRMHIIPPQTQHFYVKYTKPARMVAGMTIECSIEFTPDEWRYYYDCIRIHCPGEENLIIPIHGYPIMSTKEFPRNFTFPSIPVGHRLSRTFPLRCMAPIDFEFNIKYIQPHPAFLIEPLTGIVPANSEAEVTITFAPFEFQTATMKMELGISQFNSRGIVCTFVGSSLPGLLKTKTLSSIHSEVMDPGRVSPLDIARHKKRREPKPPAQSNLSKSKIIEKNGIRFPTDLDNPSAVAKVLMQEPGKLKVNEMREKSMNWSFNNNPPFTCLMYDMLSKKADSESSRQMKEAIFDHSVRQNVYEERQNQLRWQVKVGEEPISNQARYTVLEEKKAALNHYLFKIRGDPVIEDEYCRKKSTLSYRRSIRDIDDIPPRDANFDTYTNEMWAVRHAALERFKQAAFKILIRSRAIKRLNSLNSYMTDWREKRNPEQMEADVSGKLNKTASSTEKDLLKFTAPKVKDYKFPTYVPPNVKDDMAPDALGNVPASATEVAVKRDVPFFNLKVPHCFKLQGYKQHSSHESANGYVPTKRVRSLRTGAEDEVIHLGSETVGEARPVGVSTMDEDVVMATTKPATAATTTTAAPPQHTTQVDMLTSTRSKPVTLTPPDALFKAPEYPSLQIMNPAPGLQVFQTPQPYAEVDYDYHLNPLPRYPRSDHATNKHAVTQRKFLDREDTIRGIMAWKKFPSQGLTSLSNHPTLTSVWVPRWDDAFSQELLPEAVPALFDQLAPDDAENVLEEDDDDEEVVYLKPEMVSAQFELIDPTTPSEDKAPAPDTKEDDLDKTTEEDMFPFGNRMPSTNIPVGTHGPVAREKREEELEHFITKKYNRLGAKVRGKVDTLSAQLKDQDLVLK